MENKTNWLAIVAAVVAGMALGFLFYGALFMEQWAEANHITIEGEKMFKLGEEVEASSLPMIINTVSMLFYALVLNWLIAKTNETTLVGGLKIGAVIGLVVLFMTYVGNRFAINPTYLSMIDGGYALTLFSAMGAIIGGWRKK